MQCNDDSIADNVMIINLLGAVIISLPINHWEFHFIEAFSRICSFKSDF